MIINDDMTMEEIFFCLEEKYGDDFNWQMISGSNSSFVKELRKESTLDEPFLAGEVLAVAKCDSNDDVLFLGSIDNQKIWRIYHLTYSSSKTKGYPGYTEFYTIRSAAEYIQEQFVQEYLM